MKDADIFGPPCKCGECVQAGVTEEPTRRDPATGRMLHGFALRRGLDAFKRFQEIARKAIGPNGRGAGFRKVGQK